MKIICGKSSQYLGNRLAKITGKEIVEVEYKKFPDGEQYIKVGGDDELNDEFILIQSLVTDSDIVHLLLLLDALKESKIDLIIPYMGYARQDRKFEIGEPISIRAIATSISDKVERVTTVDVHSSEVSKYFKCEFQNVTAFREIASQVDTDNSIVIAPDEGAKGYAKEFADESDLDYDFLVKKRYSGTDIDIKPKNVDVEGRNIIIVDDIVSTGGTVSEAISFLK